MRLFELEQIQEVREYLDTNNYGSWIDARTREIIPVERHAHQDYIRQRYGLDNVEQAYRQAFKDNLVRVVHINPGQIEVQGSSVAIKAAWEIIRPTAMRMQDIHIEIYNGPNRLDFKKFELPKERSELRRFISDLN